MVDGTSQPIQNAWHRITKNNKPAEEIAMTEILFVLTIVFVAYLVYSLSEEQRNLIKNAQQRSKQQPLAETVPTVDIKSSPTTRDTAPNSAKTNQIKSSPRKKSPKTNETKPTESNKQAIKNPKTGEISPLTVNYRFAKRWLKDALVSEGLLPKVFKNTELDAQTEQHIKEALLKLSTMKAYQID